MSLREVRILSVNLRGCLRTLWILGAFVAAACGLAMIWLEFAPRKTPQDQPALSTLDASSLPAFRETFNADRGSLRILALFSPT